MDCPDSDSVKSKLLKMNNLSEEDSFAASAEEDNDIEVEKESVVKHKNPQSPKRIA